MLQGVPDDIKLRLLTRAQQRFPGQHLDPVHGCRRLIDGMKVEDGEYRFWFNTQLDHSTHLIREKFSIINKQEESCRKL
jgi:hypothetical protein